MISSTTEKSDRDLATEVSHYDPTLRVVWTGPLQENGPSVVVVEDVALKKRYRWPDLSAWKSRLPCDAAAVPLRITRSEPKQLSLF